MNFNERLQKMLVFYKFNFEFRETDLPNTLYNLEILNIEQHYTTLSFKLQGNVIYKIDENTKLLD